MSTNQDWAPRGAFIPSFTMGDRMRKARESTMVDQQTFAAELGISRRTIVRYENEAGVKVPRSALLLWSMRTNVPMEWLETGNAPGSDGPGGVPSDAECARRDSNPQPSDP